MAGVGVVWDVGDLVVPLFSDHVCDGVYIEHSDHRDLACDDRARGCDIWWDGRASISLDGADHHRGIVCVYDARSDAAQRHRVRNRDGADAHDGSGGILAKSDIGSVDRVFAVRDLLVDGDSVARQARLVVSAIGSLFRNVWEFHDSSY